MKKLFIKHIAIILTALIFITLSFTSAYEKEENVTISKGEFVKLINETFSLNEDNSDSNSTLSGAEASFIVSKLLEFDNETNEYRDEIKVSESAKSSARILLDLGMISKELVEKSELSLKDAKIFIDALKTAKMFQNSPYALVQCNLKDDFYAYKNRKYLATATINPGKMSATNFSDVENKVNNQLNEDLENILNSKGLVKNSDEWKIKELYKMYMDNEARTKSVSILKLYIDEIKNIKSINELLSFQKKYEKYFDINPFLDIDTGSDAKVDTTKWAIFVNPASYKLGSINYYKKNEKNISVQDAYIDYITKIFKYLGQTEDIGRRAKNIFEFERKRAEKDLPKEDYDDLNLRYTQYTWNDMIFYTKNCDVLTISEDLLEYFKKMNIYCANIEYVKYVDTLYIESNLPVLKDYAILEIYNVFSKALGDDVLDLPKDLNKALYGEIGEDKEIKERAQAFVIENMDQIFSNIYAKRHVSSKTKEDVTDMVEEIRNKFCERINNLTWMSDSTKKEAIEKLNSIKAYIAYPEEYEIDFKNTPNLKSKSEDGNLIEWTLAKKYLEYEEYKKLLNKSVSSNVWKNVSTYIVNAFYMPTLNSIVIPAGILQAPFYDHEASIEENLGGIGSVIAHEFTHAFDNSGAKYDKNGTLKNWWSDEDFAHFNEITENVSKELSKIKFGENNVNGKLCTGEIIADLGGEACVLDIASSKPGLDLGKVMEAWSIVWATRMPKEMAFYLLSVDVHAPSKVRVNFVLSQMDDFYDIYDIKEGDGMYVPKEKRIIIW